MPIATVNPATGETVETFTALVSAALETKLQQASEAFLVHRRTTVRERARLLLQVAQLLDTDVESLATTMTLEVGKTLQSSRDEVKKCATGCRYYAENADALLADRFFDIPGKIAFTRCFPLGPVLAIMPWNFPLWQVFRFAAPALMAGNVGLLKHAENVPRCALAIESLFIKAGFAEGVFQALLIEQAQVADIIGDPRVAAVTLTGSEAAGRIVAAQAGKALKQSVLELGGSDPFIVLESADLETAVETAVKARVLNNGQSCIAAKRFILAEPIAKPFTELFLNRMEALQIGDPMDPGTDVGPLAMPRLLEKLDQQVQDTLAAGARLLSGGHRLNRPGNFYAPTVLANIPRHSPAYHEELFGPVALLFTVPNVDAAIALANDTPFGLGASVWSNDDAEQDRCIQEIEAGMVFVNQMVASDPRLPFGGIKNSGYGRELSGEGMRAFVNLKTVSISSDE